jgi:3-methyl-2-oxobutanoate hydroxymethyltransferase
MHIKSIVAGDREQTVNSVTIPQLKASKGGTPGVALTAYTTPMARLLDPHVDVLSVGDSVGMVLYGMETTLGVTLDMMICHGAAVVRGAKRACVVVDLPFGSYQESPQLAFRSAARVMAETGCSAVKLEGGVEMAETIAFLVDRGIPVLAHVGLKPQSVHQIGGFRAQGKTPAEAARILADGQAVAKAGAFAIVVEGVIEPVARQLTESVDIPTVGIGAGPACDGQALVTEDILGLFPDFTPKFVKRYAELGEALSAAVQEYAEDVRAGRFPGPEHCYRASDAGKKSANGKTVNAKFFSTLQNVIAGSRSLNTNDRSAAA